MIEQGNIPIQTTAKCRHLAMVASLTIFMKMLMISQHNDEVRQLIPALKVFKGRFWQRYHHE